MTCLVLATRNAHKVEEIRLILGDGFCVRSQLDFPGAPGVIEDAGTFAGNASKKAESLALWLTGNGQTSRLNEPFLVLADDSGLEVDALNGAPGVYSARFAAEDAHSTGNSSDEANNAKLLRLLADVPTERRTARFRCVLALAAAGRTTRLFVGACEGRIALSASGSGGFGYDPLFIPDGFARSFAALGEDEKNKISHRAHALAKLRDSLASD